MSVRTVHILSRIRYLNEITGQPTEAFCRDDNGNNHWNVGSYFLNENNNTLDRITDDNGGSTSPLDENSCTKAVLYQKINAFIIGVELGLKLAEDRLDKALLRL